MLHGNKVSHESKSTQAQSKLQSRLIGSFRDLESSMGTSQKTLLNSLRSSMPLLKPSSEGTTTDAGEQTPNPDTFNMIQSLELKHALSSMESDSPKPFSSLGKNLERFQQKLLQDEQQMLENDQTIWDSNCAATMRPFKLFRPKDSFLVLLAAHLMNPKLMSTNSDKQNDPVQKHLFMLLNIVQLIRDGSRSRLEATEQKNTDINNNQLTNSTTSKTSQYRWSILKGSFYFYNVTYTLMKLNMKNVTHLMSNALQDISSIQFWLENEANARLVCQPSTGQLEMSPVVRHQFATGQLMPVWQSVLAAQEASLLVNAFQSTAYLLGKDSQADYAAAQCLGTTLAQILSLLDDFCHLKQVCSSMQIDPPEQWTVTQHFNFLLKLPVLLYIKEASDKASLELSATETDCNKLARNVSLPVS